MTGNLRAAIEALMEQWADIVGPADFGMVPVANVRAILAAHPAEESAQARYVTVTTEEMNDFLVTVEDLVYQQTGRHVFRSGWDGSFTSRAAELVQYLAALGVTVTGEESDRG